MKKHFLLLAAILLSCLAGAQCTGICITIPGNTPQIDLCDGGTIQFTVENQSGSALTDIDLAVTLHANQSASSAIAMDGTTPVTVGTPAYSSLDNYWLLPLPDTYTLQSGAVLSVTMNVAVDCTILTNYPGQYPIATAINIQLLDNGANSMAQLSGAVNSMILEFPGLVMNMSPYTSTGPITTPTAPSGFHYTWRSVTVNNPYEDFIFSPVGNPLRGFRVNTHYNANSKIAGIYTTSGTSVSVDVAPTAPAADVTILFDGSDFQQISSTTSNTWEAGDTTITYWELLQVANCNAIYQSQSTVGWNCPGTSLTHSSALCYTSSPQSLGTIPANGGNPQLQRSSFNYGTPDYCYGPNNTSTYSFSYTNIGTAQATNITLHFEDNPNDEFAVSFTNYTNFTLAPMNPGDLITPVDVDHINVFIAALDPGQMVTISWSVQHQCPATVCTQDVYIDDWRYDLSYGGFCNGTTASHGMTNIATPQRGGGLMPIGPGLNALTGNTPNIYNTAPGTAEFGLSLNNANQAALFTWPGNGANQGITLRFSIGPDMNVYQYQNTNHLLTSVRIYIGTFLVPTSCYTIAYEAGVASNTAPDVLEITLIVNQNGLNTFLSSHSLQQTLAGMVDNLFLVVDLEPHCNAGSSNFCDLEVYHIPDATCPAPCLIPLFCSTNNPIVINCPGCNNHGIFVDDFKFWRTTFGLPDTNNDGIADSQTPLAAPVDDPSELPMGVAERRIMYQDQFKTSVRGHVVLDPSGYHPTTIDSPPFDTDGTNFGWERWTLRLQFGPDGATGSGCWDDVEMVPNGITVWIDGVPATISFDPVIEGDYYEPNSHEYCIHLDCDRLQAANPLMPAMLINGMNYRIDCEFRLNNNIGFGVADIECAIIANCYASLRDEDFTDPTSWLVHLDDCTLSSQTDFLDDFCSGTGATPFVVCDDDYPTVLGNNLTVDDCNDIRWICINGTNNTSFDEVGFEMRMFEFMTPANDEATRAGACLWQFRGHPYNHLLPRRRMLMANNDIPFGLIFPYEHRNWVQLEQLSYTITPPLPAVNDPVLSLESLSLEDNLYLENNLNVENNFFDTGILGTPYNFTNAGTGGTKYTYYNYLTDFVPPHPAYPPLPVLPAVPHGNPSIDFNGWHTNGSAPNINDPIHLADDSHVTRGWATMRFECPPPEAEYTITLTEVDQFEHGVGDMAFENGVNFNGDPVLWQDDTTLVFTTINNQPYLDITDNIGIANEGTLCFNDIVIDNTVPGNPYFNGSEAPYVWFGIEPTSGYQGWGDMTFTLVASGRTSYPSTNGFTIPATTLANGDYVFFLNQFFDRNAIVREETFTFDICVEYDCVNPPNPITDLMEFNFGWSCNPLDSGLWEFTNTTATSLTTIRQSFHDLITNVPNAINNTCHVETEPLNYGLYDPQLTMTEQVVTTEVVDLCSELEYNYRISNPAFSCLEELWLNLDIPDMYQFSGIVEYSYMGSTFAPLPAVVPMGNGEWIADVSAALPNNCLYGFQNVPYVQDTDFIDVRFYVTTCCDVDYYDKAISVYARGKICDPNGIAYSPSNTLPYTYDPLVTGTNAPLNEIHVANSTSVSDNGCGQYTLNIDFEDGTSGTGNPVTNNLNDIHIMLPPGCQYISVNAPYTAISTSPLIIHIPQGMTMSSLENTAMIINFALTSNPLCGPTTVDVQPYSSGTLSCSLPACNMPSCVVNASQQAVTPVNFTINPPVVQLIPAGNGCQGYVFTATGGCGNYSWTVNGNAAGSGNSLQVGPSATPQVVCVKDALFAGGLCSASVCFTTDTCSNGCTADFSITQLDNCCYHFEDLSPDVFPCYDGGWGIFNNTDTSWVATYQGVSSFDHCFDENGEYLICNTVCCEDGSQDKICYVLQVDGCSCSADFKISKVDNCCYLFEDMTPGVFPCSDGGWGIFNNTDTSWVATYQGVSSFQHCFEENGEYLVCNTVCCEDGSHDKICHVVDVTGCDCSADFSITQTSSCCYHFEDQTPDILPCPEGGWGIFLADGTWVASYYNTSSVDHCFETPGEYQICNTVCCGGENLDKVCYTIYVEGCACTADFYVDQIDNCCFKFTDPSPDVLPCESGGWGIFTSNGDWVATYQNTNSFEHCFELDGIYLVCNTVCCEDGSLVKSCQEIRVEGCNCKPKIITEQINNCCYRFTDPSYHLECDMENWDIYDANGTLIASYPLTNAIVHCFDGDGLYMICRRICCADGSIREVCTQVDVVNCTCKPHFTYTIDDECCYHFIGSYPVNADCADGGWTIYTEWGELLFSSPGTSTMTYCFPEPGTYNVCFQVCCKDKVEKFCQKINHLPGCCEREVLYISEQYEDPCCYLFTDPTTGEVDCRSWTLMTQDGAVLYSGSEPSFEWCIDEGKTFILCLKECCVSPEGEYSEAEYCQEISCGTLRQSAAQLDNALGQYMMSTDSDVQIAPNPNNGRFRITTTDESLIRKCVLISTRGMILWEHTPTGPSTSLELDIQNIESGLYYLVISTDSGISRVRCVIAK